MYKGKEVCQGCKKAGTEKSRQNKDDLCYDCEKVLTRGKILIFDSSIEYTSVFQHFYAFHSDMLNNMVHEILASANNPHADTIGKLENIKYSTGSNGRYYRIDSRLFKPLQELFLEMEKLILDAEKERKALATNAAGELQVARDRIFSEGVEYGKKLLLQLNAGSLSMADFDKTVYREREKY